MSSHIRNLIVDVGNSGTKAACFDGEEIMLPITRFDPEDWEAIGEMATNLRVNNIIYSTVANVPSTAWIDKRKIAGQRTFTLDRSRPLPFATDYRTIETLGQDRIAAMAGTIGRVTTARLIVDAGSCVTFDLMDSNDRHLGGNISPGIRMRLRAMHEFTAKLPVVALAKPSNLMGRSTEQAMLHGGVLGAAYEIESLFARLVASYRDLRLVLTGGDAGLLSPYLSMEVIIYPNLVLRGLNQIVSFYVSK